MTHTKAEASTTGLESLEPSLSQDCGLRMRLKIYTKGESTFRLWTSHCQGAFTCLHELQLAHVFVWKDNIHSRLPCRQVPKGMMYVAHILQSGSIWSFSSRKHLVYGVVHHLATKALAPAKTISFSSRNEN